MGREENAGETGETSFFHQLPQNDDSSIYLYITSVNVEISQSPLSNDGGSDLTRVCAPGVEIPARALYPHMVVCTISHRRTSDRAAKDARKLLSPSLFALSIRSLSPYGPFPVACLPRLSLGGYNARV